MEANANITVHFGVNSLTNSTGVLGGTVGELIGNAVVQASFCCGDNVSAVVNGQIQDRGYVLRNGDDVTLVTQAHEKGC